MADIPVDVGYFSLSSYIIEGLADSSDVGTLPDALPLNGTCKITTEGIPASRPYLVAPADDTLIYPREITCRLEDGQIIPPDNGSDGSGDGGEPVGEQKVYLIANKNNNAIDLEGWTWVATFTPATLAKWKKFVIKFSGEPGEEVSIAQAALSQAVLSLSQQPTVWIVTVPEGEDPLDYVPENARVGQFMFDTTTENLYKITGV